MHKCSSLTPGFRFTAEEMYCSMAEWAFLPSDARDVKAVCEAYFNEKMWPILPIEIELVKTDEYFMSPWSNPKEGSPTGYPDYLVKFNFMYVPDGCRGRRAHAIQERPGRSSGGSVGGTRGQGVPVQSSLGQDKLCHPRACEEQINVERIQSVRV